jgi:hypothetical protein
MVQLVIGKDKQPIQQPIIALVPTTVQITTSLPIHIPKGSDHQPSDGGQPTDSLRGSSHGRDPFGKPPFNPLVGHVGWPALDSHMIIPLWYQPPVMQLVLEPTTKLPYMKLQYPTYVKEINLNAHIKVLKKGIKASGEIIKSDIINLFNLLLGIISLNGEKITFKTIQNALLRSWNRHFANSSKK